MPIEVDPNSKHTLEYPKDSGTRWITRPLTLTEEHQLFDVQSTQGIWVARGWLLQRVLLDVENWKLPYEAGELGGASEEFVRHMPVNWRKAVCEHVWSTIVLTEDDLEK